MLNVARKTFSASAFILPVVLLITPAIGAEPQAKSFVCSSANGVPATSAVTPNGEVPVIRWTSTTFSGAGWSPERRCQEVTARFNSYMEKGMLEYITTGRMNSLPVICVTRTEGGGCDGLLYTLKPGQNATATLKKLFDIRTKPGAAPLNETTSRIYVKVDDLIRGGSPVSPAPTLSPAPTAAPGRLF
nr:COP23 domain-containing protein [Synechococcus sp. Minos11]